MCGTLPGTMLRRVLLLLLLLAFSLAGLGANVRSVEATFVARLSAIPEKAGRIRVWVPLPESNGDQTIEGLRIESPYRWTRGAEKEFGNEYLYAEIEAASEGMELLKLHFRATRQEVTFSRIRSATPPKQELNRHLRDDRLVAISPRIRQLAGQVTSGAKGPLARAKAIYNHVLTTMKYDKTTPGWGNGDSERACDIRRGNCTDFHSLFIAMARASGIPARFVIGFPMAESNGQTSGYHCWAEFFVEGTGWIPVDPSEASKSADPARREYLFGNLDPDRIQFTVGRDLRLTPATKEPLNYFIYPYAEANGEAVGTPGISFVFRDLPASAGGSHRAKPSVDVTAMGLVEVAEPRTHQSRGSHP